MEKILIRVMAGLCVFFCVFTVTLEVIEHKYFPIPEAIVTINSSEISMPNSFEKVINGEKLMVNINTATVEELEQLPGVGEKIANYIINYREQNGAFKDVNDLLNVEKIGPKLLEKIKNNITI